MNIFARTVDSFQNFAARLGLGAGSQNDHARYGFDFISRNRVQLEAMYRSSWVVGQAVDVVAEDMTREGIDIKGDIHPTDIEKINKALERLRIWDDICNTIKWARLYGGCLAVMLVDGQDVSTPLNLNSIGKGQFKGLMVLDRWLVQPSLQDLVTEYGPGFGMPRYYNVVADSIGLANQNIHHSRVIRIDGVDLPHWQRTAENLWGQSVIERLLDRLTAFDSTTAGAAQLVYKAHLRTYKVKDLRNIIATGGRAFEGLVKQIEHIRSWQSNEGMTLMDAEDQFEAHQYSFNGLSDMLLQFGQQLSGALQIPLVRLFGQSPAGLSSSGESDLRTYYDNIAQQQERRLRTPLTTLLSVVALSELGADLAEHISFDFTSLRQLDPNEKASYASNVTSSVLAAQKAGVIDKATALKELRQSSEITGIWSNISNEDIGRAHEAIRPPTQEPVQPPIQPFSKHDTEPTHDGREGFDPNQPRDEDGRWSASGGKSGGSGRLGSLLKVLSHIRSMTNGEGGGSSRPSRGNAPAGTGNNKPAGQTTSGTAGANSNPAAQNTTAAGNATDPKQKKAEPPKNPPPALPPSSGISSEAQANAYWRKYFRNKVYDLEVKARKGGQEPIAIKVDFGTTNHAYTEKPQNVTSNDYKDRVYNEERARMLDQVFSTMKSPFVRLFNDGNDILAAPPKTNGEQFVVIIKWSDATKKYSFQSAHFKRVAQIERLKLGQDRRAYNNGPLQKSKTKNSAKRKKK